MGLGWSKNRFSPIGIDLGADSIKMLQVVPSDPPQLVAAASVNIPPEFRNSLARRHNFISENLKNLLKSQPFKGRRAILSMPAFQTLVQHLQVGLADGEDLESQIDLHLRQRLNIDSSRMVVRHFSVGPVVREGNARQEVICVAAGREAIMRYIQTAHRAKLDVVGMRDEPTAILKAFSHLYRQEDDSQRTTCFIDLGAATTKVVIAHGQTMVFAKTIHAAGDHLTRERAKALNISFAEAREQRIENVMATTGAAPAPPALAEAHDSTGTSTQEDGGLAVLQAEPTTRAEVSDASSEIIDCLIDEMRLCIRYHNSLFSDRPIDKLVFLGGESRHVTICQKIAQALGIGTQLGDPLARLVQISRPQISAGVDLRQTQPGWAVPLGVCLFPADQ